MFLLFHQETSPFMKERLPLQQILSPLSQGRRCRWWGIFFKDWRGRLLGCTIRWSQGFPGGTRGKEAACQCRDIRDAGLIPGSGRSPGGGHGNPLQYSYLENPRGQRSLVGYSPEGSKESDMPEWFSTRARTHWGDHMPYSCVHCIISIEKFKIPLLIPPAGAPALTQSQIGRLFCIFNIHLQTPNMPPFPMIPSIHCLVSFLTSPGNREQWKRSMQSNISSKESCFPVCCIFPIRDTQGAWVGLIFLY